jgi:hypothetical protein
MRVCTGCGENKPLDKFDVHSANKNCKRHSCRACEIAKRRASYVVNPERNYNNHLKQNYGIDIEQYKVMLKAQKGVCAICEEPETEIKYSKVQSLSVDHNHETGEIRGLLCNSCNRGVGLLKDSPKLLSKAANYLSKNSPGLAVVSSIGLLANPMKVG